jgi:hypothetical protein
MPLNKKNRGFIMKFEEKKFCQITTLAERWDCSVRHIYNLVEKKVLKPFQPGKAVGRKGLRIDVQNVLEVEKRGMIDISDKYVK